MLPVTGQTRKQTPVQCLNTKFAFQVVSREQGWASADLLGPAAETLPSTQQAMDLFEGDRNIKCKPVLLDVYSLKMPRKVLWGQIANGVSTAF